MSKNWSLDHFKNANLLSHFPFSKRTPLPSPFGLCQFALQGATCLKSSPASGSSQSFQLFFFSCSHMPMPTWASWSENWNQISHFFSLLLAAPIPAKSKKQDQRTQEYWWCKIPMEDSLFIYTCFYLFRFILI